MKLMLKEFQDDAVVKLVRNLRAAAKESRTGDRQAVSLSSPTGSGKTVMLTCAIELVLKGDEEHAPISDATFLWITDQPELNTQTRKKMLATSSVLTPDTLVVIDAAFDRECLKPGTVHFLNTQKIGRDKGLVSHHDRRSYSIWEIVKNTIDARPGKFFVIIDEAHRGMIEGKEQQEAATIIQKFIKGSPGEILPVPVVVGISATPARFHALLTGAGRHTRPIDVDPAEVRLSGLLKETIVLHHPKKQQPTDMTLLRESAKTLQLFISRWAGYCTAQHETPVRPLLLVQVEDGGKGQISKTDITQAMRALRDALGNLPNDAFAHSFQEGTVVKLVGGEDLRYLPPSDIDADPDVRTVFFKTSLNTGWDCPRAEVMMSFRTAADATYIAQLVGRMVRTPLARRIVDNETLNTVSLYLPHYDTKGLEAIVTKLSKPDSEFMPPVDVQLAEQAVDFQRAQGSDEAFAALSLCPSYIVPRKRRASQVRRLMKLARLLSNDDIQEDAIVCAREALLGVLKAEYRLVKDTAKFKDVVEARAKVEIEAVNWDVGTEATREGSTVQVDIAAENVDDLFEAVGRKLNEGLHKVWWRERVREDSGARERAKLELFALCMDPDVGRKVERAAQELVQKWLKEHSAAILSLEEGSRSAYDEVRNLAAVPELAPLTYPAAIQVKAAEKWLDKHVYVGEGGEFPDDLNGPERELLGQELQRKHVPWWLRNIDRKTWALCVPYEDGGEDRAMYPDFLLVRKDGKRLVVDIIDPHSINLADSPAKAAGLARFAAKHGHKFGRIDLILLDNKSWKRLDLTDEVVRQKVLGVKLPAEMKKLFDEA